MKFIDLFNKKPIIGMVHLLPLPSSPLFDGDLDKIEARASGLLPMVQMGIYIVSMHHFIHIIPGIFNGDGF